MSDTSERNETGAEEFPLVGSSRPLRMPAGLLRANTAYLFIITLVLTGAVLRLMGSIFIPFVIALLLSFVFIPVVAFLVKFRVPRFAAVTAVLLILLAFGYLVVLVVYSSVQSLLREFPKYQARFTAVLREMIDMYDLPADILSQLEITRTVGNALISFSGNFMAFASGFMVVMIFLLFLLMEKPYLRKKMQIAFGERTRRRVTLILTHINSQIARYLAVKIFVSLLTGTIVFFMFSAIGVDFPFIWAIMTFLFNFIPSIGSVVITFVTGVFALIQFYPDWNPVILTFSGMAVTQFLIGNVIDPKMTGDRLNLSPVIILLSLLVWGWLWDVAGLFLAVPLTVSIKIVLENIPGLEPFGVLMGTGNFVPGRKGFRQAYRERFGHAAAGHAAAGHSGDVSPDPLENEHPIEHSIEHQEARKREQ
jgi:AI-2 transport protein TqsA